MRGKDGVLHWQGRKAEKELSRTWRYLRAKSTVVEDVRIDETDLDFYRSEEGRKAVSEECRRIWQGVRVKSSVVENDARLGKRKSAEEKEPRGGEDAETLVEESNANHATGVEGGGITQRRRSWRRVIFSKNHLGKRKRWWKFVERRKIAEGRTGGPKRQGRRFKK